MAFLCSVLASVQYLTLHIFGMTGRFSNESGSLACFMCPDDLSGVPSGSESCSPCLSKYEVFRAQGFDTLCVYSFKVSDAIVFAIVSFIALVSIGTAVYTRGPIVMGIALVLSSANFASDVSYLLLSEFWHPALPFACLLLLVFQVVPFLYTFYPSKDFFLWMWNRAPMIPFPANGCLRSTHSRMVIHNENMMADDENNGNEVGAVRGGEGVDRDGDSDDEMVNFQTVVVLPTPVTVANILYSILWWMYFIVANTLLFILNFILWPLAFLFFMVIGVLLFTTKLLSVPHVSDWWLTAWQQLPAPRDAVVLHEEYNQMVVDEMLFACFPQIIVQVVNNRSDYNALAVISLLLSILVLCVHIPRFLFFMIKKKVAWKSVPYMSSTYGSVDSQGASEPFLEPGAVE